MKQFFSFLVTIFFSIPATITFWLVTYFAFNQTFLVATAVSLGGGIAIYGGISAYLKHRSLKRYGLTRKEYRYIKGNLDEAKQKITRLNKALVSMRDISSIKDRIEFIRITRKIYGLTKKEPKRFYKAERFYFTHLDSAVELAEKYVFLSAQPKMDKELKKSLADTRRTLDKIKDSIEEDLYQILSDDIDQLHFEMDVVKHSMKTVKESQLLKEGRR
ncbi:5-bromo-4-chloroindolyl phosphate hydrolysis family protein [Bacillus sp. V59.32b]|uniref:5-bromo-4-chloroindolyl phosphate hydrolysis family protein n=1 Tax=Bacillus sp. V59.32b TaxID=1758642 RepID=UPI000E3CBF8B|nr:5-bromo-4-chloroindolyl phosphate hydrolysis family protein [Bacillus sp. V59.32b]RFU68525.1 protein xpaC [Bacillus sp. V59.32b]